MVELLTLQGKRSLVRAKTAHSSGHLPPLATVFMASKGHVPSLLEKGRSLILFPEGFSHLSHY
jgi:hypothetical protein